MGIKVGINGFGRIGRLVTRVIMEGDDIDLVGVNDIAGGIFDDIDDITKRLKHITELLAHLFKYDSTYGIYPGTVKVDGDMLVIDGKPVKVAAERDPANLPWGELGADIVLESTGFFTKKEDAEKHIAAGAKRVIIAAPAEGDVPMFVLGVNTDNYDPAQHHVISNASCTTNCLAPVAKVLHDSFTIEQGVMTTTHAVTNDQNVLDSPHKDFRRARASYESMIPTTTGAAAAIGLVIPDIEGRMDGMAIRVPTITVSLVDLVCQVKKGTTADEVNAFMKEAAEGDMKGILQYNDELLVSVDYRKNPHSSIFDSTYTKVMGGHLIKAMAWYDNEWGYSCRCVDMFRLMASRGL